MIKLTKLNGKEFFLNPHQIEFIEEVPESLITMLSGKTIYVQETVDEIIKKIIEYRRKIGIFKKEIWKREYKKDKWINLRYILNIFKKL